MIEQAFNGSLWVSFAESVMLVFSLLGSAFITTSITMRKAMEVKIIDINNGFYSFKNTIFSQIIFEQRPVLVNESDHSEHNFSKLF